MADFMELLKDARKKLAGWIEGSQPEPDQSVLAEKSPTIEQIIGVEIEAEKTRQRIQRLTTERTGFLVLCSSCTSLHELEAVCYRCGAPLCQDTTNCRLSIYVGDLGTNVFICPTCKES